MNIKKLMTLSLDELQRVYYEGRMSISYFELVRAFIFEKRYDDIFTWLISVEPTMSLPILSGKGLIEFVKLISDQVDNYEEAIDRAITYDRRDVVRYLIEKKPTQYNLNLSLHYFNKKGYFDDVKYVVKSGADVRCENDICIWAVFGKDIELIQCLIDRGCDVTAHNSKALGYATWLNDIKMTKYLIEKGCDYRMDNNICEDIKKNKSVEMAKYFYSLDKHYFKQLEDMVC